MRFVTPRARRRYFTHRTKRRRVRRALVDDYPQKLEPEEARDAHARERVVVANRLCDQSWHRDPCGRIFEGLNAWGVRARRQRAWRRDVTAGDDIPVP